MLDPRRHLSITRDGEEVELLGQILLLPVHLPHRVSMFSRPNGGGINRSIDLVTDVEYENSSIVTTTANKDDDAGGNQGHDRVSVECVLGWEVFFNEKQHTIPDPWRIKS